MLICTTPGLCRKLSELKKYFIAAAVILCDIAGGETLLGNTTALAQNFTGAVTGDVAGQPGQSPLAGNVFLFQTFWYVSLVLFVVYFLVIRPANRKISEQEHFLKGLKSNDEVLVSGVMLGKVISVAGEVVAVELGANNRVRVLASGLSKRKTDDDTQKKHEEEGKDKEHGKHKKAK